MNTIFSNSSFQKKTTVEVCKKTVICQSYVESKELAYIFQMACVSCSIFFVRGEQAFSSGRRGCPFFKIPQAAKQAYHRKSRFLQEVQILHRRNAISILLITVFSLLRHKSKPLWKPKALFRTVRNNCFGTPRLNAVKCGIQRTKQKVRHYAHKKTPKKQEN